MQNAQSQAILHHLQRKSFSRLYTFSRQQAVVVFPPPRLSEGTHTNHRHHHNVAKRGQHGDPQPDGVAGHLPIVLCFRGSGVASVEVGGGRLQRRVAVVRRIHEGSTDGWEVLREKER